MRRLTFSLVLMSLSLCASPQTRSLAKSEAAVIQYVKNLPAFSFDSRLPRVSLEYFLAYETEGAPAKWTTTKCEEQHSADESADAKRSSSTCGQGDFDLNNGSALTILIRVEGRQNEKFGGAQLVSLRVIDSTGNMRQVPSLGDLPMELHRWSSRVPKDVPLPGRAS